MVDVDIDPSRPRRVVAVAIFFLCLTSFAVALRLFSKIFVTRSLTVDDKILCFLQAVFTTFLITEILGALHGTGRDATELSSEDKRKALQFFFSGELLYIITSVLLKVCVGILLLRIAIFPIHLWILRALLLSTIVFGTMYLFLVTFQCRPVHTFWDEGPRTPGKCFERNIVLGTTYTATTLNCLADWAFGILPLFIIWSLNLRLKTKILSTILLGFASIASIATIIRAITVPSVLSEKNFLRDTTGFAIWSTVEPGIGITAACAPGITPLVRHLCGKRRQREYSIGIWKTRQLPTIILTENAMSKRHFRGSLSRNEPAPSKEMPRLRFDDFTYESRISGPNTRPTRPATSRNRASWAFSLRPGLGSSSSSAAGSESSKSLTSASSAVTTGGAQGEPPLSGIMKTMEFELSYEERTWTTQGGMKYGDDCVALRPDAIEGMRRLLGSDLQLLPDGEHPSMSLNLDVESWFPSSSLRHSAPPEANWKWPENNGDRKNSEDEDELYLSGLGSQAQQANGQLDDS